MKKDGSYHSTTTARWCWGNVVKIAVLLMVVVGMGWAGTLYTLKLSTPARRDSDIVSSRAWSTAPDQWWANERKIVTASVRAASTLSNDAMRRGQEGGLLGDLGLDRRRYSLPIRISLSNDAIRRGQEGGLLGQ